MELASSVRNMLDQQCHKLQNGQGDHVVEELCSLLLPLRLHSLEEDWQRVKETCLAHPIRELLHQAPYTFRAFQKPRGYAGDAVMLDYVYDGVPPDSTSSIGRQVFAGTTGLSNGKSVIARRDLLTLHIDALAATKNRPRILSLACGHLREAQQSLAVKNRAIGEYYAIDHDQETLKVVDEEQRDQGVTPVHGSVVSVIRRKVEFREIDFAYAAGLYDYLSESLAAKTTKALFDMLAPGGQLLVANYVPNSHGRGYMDAFMDWSLIYRTEQDLQAVMALVPDGLIASRSSFHDAIGNVVYLEVIRA